MSVVPLSNWHCRHHRPVCRPAPQEPVVTVATLENVLTGLAIHGVVAVTANESVLPQATPEEVFAGRRRSD